MTEPTRSTFPESTRIRALGLIRFALLLGVLMFGAAVWWAHRQTPLPPNPALTPDGLRALVIVLGIVAIVVMSIMRVLGARSTDARRRATFGIIAWAAAEAPALAGGIYYFAFADPRWYAAGLIVLVASFVAVPIRPPS